jgi:hypothetical protein
MDSTFNGHPAAETPHPHSQRRTAGSESAANPQAERSSPAVAGNPQSNAPPPRRGRPRVLDEFKRREICALLAAGCSAREAARYVGCAHSTIRREAAHNPQFKDALRQSEMVAELKPLQAMQRAVGTSWRAAAWLLERAYPERFARRNQSAWSARQVRDAFAEVQNIVTSEVRDPMQRWRIEKRLRMTLEYLLHAGASAERKSRDLRHVLKFLEEKENMADPLGPFGLKSPNPLDFFKEIAPVMSDERGQAATGAPQKQRQMP